MEDIIDVEATQVDDATETQKITPVIVPKGAVAAFDPVKAALADLRQIISSAVINVETADGERDARALRQKCVKLRTSTKALYDNMNRPLKELQDAWRKSRDEITAEVEQLEEPLDQAIKAKERRQEEERQRKIEAEKARIASIRARIAAIAKLPTIVFKLGSVGIGAEIEILENMEISEGAFAEFTDEALALREATLETLTSIQAEKKSAEDAAEAVRQAQAEAKRVADEAAAKAAEAARQMQEQRDAFEAEKKLARGQQAEVERQQKAEAARLAAEQRRLEAASQPAPAATPTPTPAPADQSDVVKYAIEDASDVNIIRALKAAYLSPAAAVIDRLRQVNLDSVEVVALYLS